MNQHRRPADEAGQEAKIEAVIADLLPHSKEQLEQLSGSKRVASRVSALRAKGWVIPPAYNRDGTFFYCATAAPGQRDEWTPYYQQQIRPVLELNEALAIVQLFDEAKQAGRPRRDSDGPLESGVKKLRSKLVTLAGARGTVAA